MKDDASAFGSLGSESLDEVRSFYWSVIDGRGCQAGWIKGVYPSDAMIASALERSELFAARADDGRITALFIANTRCNEGYSGIDWKVDCKPGEFLVPHALATSPEFRHEGWGRAAVQAVVSLARERGLRSVRLDVLARNSSAEALYVSEGFEYVGTAHMYYEDTDWTDYRMFELPL